MPVKRAEKKLHKLRYWRDIAGLKQSDLAILIGCTEQNYNMKENGNTELKRKEMLSIQGALNEKMKKIGRDVLTLDDIFLP